MNDLTSQPFGRLTVKERCRERPATELSYRHKNGYSRNPDDYQWLCKPCHMLKDKGSGAIMTKAQMHRIREKFKCKAATRQELADIFKVSVRTIHNILHYEGAYKVTVNPNIFKELIEGLT
jgi:hypothetical protein